MGRHVAAAGFRYPSRLQSRPSRSFATSVSGPFGRLIDRTGSFDLGLAINGCMPLVAFVALWLFWDLPRDRKQVAVAGEITRS